MFQLNSTWKYSLTVPKQFADKKINKFRIKKNKYCDTRLEMWPIWWFLWWSIRVRWFIWSNIKLELMYVHVLSNICFISHFYLDINRPRKSWYRDSITTLINSNFGDFANFEDHNIFFCTVIALQHYEHRNSLKDNLPTYYSMHTRY